MPMDTKSLMPVPTKKDRNAPNAALVAVDDLLRLNTHSPMNAPAKGQTSGPKGNGNRKPTSSPIIAPQLPALLPPKRLVIHGVSRKSMTVTMTVATPQTISGVTPISMPAHWRHSSPTNDRGGPGSPGMTHPRIPTISSNAAMMINAISILGI